MRRDFIYFGKIYCRMFRTGEKDFMYFEKIYWRMFRTGEKGFYIFWEDILEGVENR